MWIMKVICQDPFTLVAVHLEHPMLLWHRTQSLLAGHLTLVLPQIMILTQGVGELENTRFLSI